MGKDAAAAWNLLPKTLWASCNNSSDGRFPCEAALANFKPKTSESLELGPRFVVVGEPSALLPLPPISGPIARDEKRGAKTSSKKGTASETGLLLKLNNAFAARGVSGKRDEINTCNRAPHECPIPTTGNAPYCLARVGATASNFVRISSQVARWSKDRLKGVATTKNPSAASFSNK
jgi:hypothetical protein